MYHISNFFGNGTIIEENYFVPLENLWTRRNNDEIIGLVYLVCSSAQVFPQDISNDDNSARNYFDLFVSSPYEELASISSDVPRITVSREELTEISSLCPKNGFFGSFNANHSAAVSLLAKKFEAMRQTAVTLLDVTAASKFIKHDPNIHPKVYYSAKLQVELQDVPHQFQKHIPSPVYLFPTNFFPEEIIQSNPDEPVLLDETIGEDNGRENALWYFRENVLLNAHHWFWHIIYPNNRPIAANRRRGELFSFFHHDIMARYATERISNGLQPQIPLDLKLNTFVKEGYNPHLRDGISTRRWNSRRPNQELINEIPVTLTFTNILTNFTSNKFRVEEAISVGRLTYSGEPGWFPINKADHIKTLGEIAEGTADTINPDIYGGIGFHNLGHVVISTINGNSTDGVMGVMGDNAVALRDPIFYRWHQFVDDVFTTYKSTHLPPYGLLAGNHSLIVPGVITSSVKLIPESDNDDRSHNLLYTYWNITRMHLENGLDFRNPMEIGGNAPPNRNVTVDAKHLDHEEFYYEIKIENERRTYVHSAVRIFMAPRYKTDQEKERRTMEEQRNFFFTMDSFTVELHPGENILHRKSIDSTLTVPWPKSIREIADELNNTIQTNSTRDTKCGCGFPHHLLLPKGTEEGMTFDIFVIVTEEALEQPVTAENTPDPNKCRPAHIHCGVQGLSYPDSKPMGYPFDRKPYEIPHYIPNKYDNTVKIKHFPVETLEEYVAHIPNSCTTQVVVTHHNIQYGI